MGLCIQDNNLVSDILSGGASQPKTLFQKTRSDTARMQKGVYGSHLVGRMPAAKGYRSTSSGANLSSGPLFPVVPSSTASGSRVTVTAVPVQRPSVKPSQSQSRPSSTPASSHPNARAARPVESSAPTLNTSAPRPESPLSRNQSLRVPERSSLKPPNAKKDPMAALFMPKKRAFSQLPTDSGIRTRPRPRDPTSAGLPSGFIALK